MFTKDGNAIEFTSHGTLSFGKAAVYFVVNNDTEEEWEFWTGAVDETIKSTLLIMVGPAFHKNHGRLFHGKKLRGEIYTQTTD
jgi:hypothetical protein